MLPAIYSIVAPSPVEAQSVGPAAPTLTSVSPNQGLQGTTVAVTLTGTNFVVGGTTVNVSGSGVTVATVTVNSIRSRAVPDNGTSLTANFVIDPTAAAGSAHGDGHDGGRDKRRANLHDRSADARRADADERRRRIREPAAPRWRSR